MLDAALAYLHFVSIFGLFAALSMEAVLLRPALIGDTGRWIWKIDVAYFVAAIGAAASGLSRAIWGLKGWAYYAHNPVFHAKLGIFVLIALLSIPPTLRYLRWRRAYAADAAYAVPQAELRSARRYVMIEVHLALLLPLCAVLMARGLYTG